MGGITYVEIVSQLNLGIGSGTVRIEPDVRVTNPCRGGTIAAKRRSQPAAGFAQQHTNAFVPGEGLMEDLTLALVTLTAFVMLFVIAIFADRAGADLELQADDSPFSSEHVAPDAAVVRVDVA